MADDNKATGASSTGRLSLKLNQATKGKLADKGKESKKKWLTLGVGLAVAILAISALTGKKTETGPKTSVKNQESVIDLTPKDVTQKGWQSQSQADIQSLGRRLEQLEAENRRLKANSGEGGMKQPALPPGVVAPPSAIPTLDMKPSGVVPPPLPAPQAPQPSKAPTAQAIDPALPLAPISAAPEETRAKRAFAAPQTEEEKAAQVKPVAEVSYKKNKFASYMTPGFAKAVMLHGVDASTSLTAQSNPQPVMLRIQDYSVLPGSARYDIKSCFVVAAASGNISSERVEMRLSSISCVDKANGLVLEQPVKGYVVDSDGSVGLRGKLVDRQGAKLQKTMIAGFAQGLTQSAATAASSTSTSAVGTVTTISGSDALKQAGFTGLGSSAGMLANFYLKQAEAMSPILEVSANRIATVVFSEGASLAWQDSDATFQKEYKLKEATK